MADGTVSWFAGIDWGSERHQVCLLDAAGQVVGERAFRHGGAGLATLCDLLVSVAGEPGRVAVAVEVPHGPVVDAPLDRGWEYRQFRVWAAIVDTKEVPNGPTQSPSHSRRAFGSAAGGDGSQSGARHERPS